MAGFNIGGVGTGAFMSGALVGSTVNITSVTCATSFGRSYGMFLSTCNSVRVTPTTCSLVY